MIKEFKFDNSTKVNVYMKDGREFLACDIATICGENKHIFLFWFEDAMRLVPMIDILHIDFYKE